MIDLNLDSLFQATEYWSLLGQETGYDIVTFTSFISMDVKDGGKVVDTPVEEGSFATYNKVDNPREVKCTLATQGTDEELQAYIQSLTDLRNGTDLVMVSTPVFLYENMNLEEFSYSLKVDDGRGVLYADLSLVEIRQVEMEYSDAKVAPQQDRGKVQAKQQPSGSQKTQEKERSLARSGGDWLRGK